MSAPGARAEPLEAVPATVVELAGRLRAGGVPVSTSEVMDAVGGLARLDLGGRLEVRTALKACLVKDDSHDVLFHRAFDAVYPVWRPPARPSDSSGSGTDGARDGGAAQADDDVVDEVVRALREGDETRIGEAVDHAIDRFGSDPQDGRSAGHHTQRTLRRMNITDLYQRYLEGGAHESDLDRSIERAEARAAMDQLARRMADLMAGRLREAHGVSLQQLDDLEDRPLLRAGADELVALRAALRPLARRLAARLGARRRSGGVGVDMRRTIRASMGTGGTPVNPVLRRRRPTKPDLVVLCDVSGSTAQFAPFTLTLLHAVHQEFRRVRSFVFVDGIVEVTDLLDGSPGVLDPRHLLGRRGLVGKDGRSDYGRVLGAFLDRWGDAVTAKTTVIIAGDARSHDHLPATRLVAELAHRARRLYWLNPEPRAEWDTTDSRAGDYAEHCTAAFEVSTIRHLVAAVAQIA